MRLHSEKSVGQPRLPHTQHKRRGIFAVLLAISLVAVMAFIALGVDLGMVSLTKTRMQNACDAAALAAATEISNAVQQAGQDAGEGDDVQGIVQDANSIAVGAAKDMAAPLARENGGHLAPDADRR